MLENIKNIIPKKLFRALQPTYHYCLAVLGTILYRFPSQHIKVVGITGTKGKSSTVEFVNAILEQAGFKTALMGTIRFKVGHESRPNLYKMSMPGRFFVQKFLREAVDEQCDWAVLEMTSEGMKQFRHFGIELDAGIFLNIAPEHIESHGSFENYLKAKLKLVEALEQSKKPNRVMVVNMDDKHAESFLKAKVEHVIPFEMKDAGFWEANDDGIAFTIHGERVRSPLHGSFMILNALAASAFAESQGISTEIIKKGIESVGEIKGRVQFVKLPDNSPKKKKQNFSVVVDYAHTAESLEALYSAFPNKRKICVLGNTGGGRDVWKRPVMAGVADKYCDNIILTNEDPYDEDPEEILKPMKKAIKNKNLSVIMDRREAINTAIGKAKEGDVVLITGKGTDPYIMGAKGKKTPWSDAQVAQEELEKIL
jgi:UDP-N-acetylmuramoyl-L-alanyl-D-glutamate--2,6-diaminopimelate ligase